MGSKRLNSFDFISGVAILIVILYHAAQWSKLIDTEVASILIKSLYFIIPWFFFKMGYFHNTFYSFNYMIKKTLVNYFIFYLYGILLGLIVFIAKVIYYDYSIIDELYKLIYKIFRYGDFVYNIPLWFLFSFIFVKIMLFFISRKHYLIIICSFLTITLSGFQYYYLPNLDIGSYSSIMPGLSFALVGALTRKYDILNHLAKFKYLLILTSIIASFLCPSFIRFHYNDLIFGNYWFYFINSILAIYSLLLIFKGVKSSSVQWLGQNSILFFIYHWPLFFVIQFLIRAFNITSINYIHLILYFLLSVTFMSIAAFFFKLYDISKVRWVMRQLFIAFKKYNKRIEKSKVLE